eukprot:m.58162 g.58162  ORF g.58162 m.58162 type:complete len:292 (-) comp7127_c0_seq2:427-1302(-)
MIRTKPRTQRASPSAAKSVHLLHNTRVPSCQHHLAPLKSTSSTLWSGTSARLRPSTPKVISKYNCLSRAALTPFWETSEPVVGYCKGEPIYPRENVQPLLSEQRWLKEGRVVRTGEQAHKTVPARGKAADDEAPGTPVFGLWQTQEYEPPVAADGKVPRNQYGTVDLYKPSMLPIGTVFLDLPRAAREAKELGIDYAYAVTGFEYQNGQMTPIKSGIVVCSEFEDLLRDAWRQRQQLNAEKAVRNRERQVVRRWAQLVQRLLLHNRVAGVFRSTGALSYSVEEDGDCETED